MVSSAFLKDKAGLDVSSCKTNEEIMKRFRVNSEWKMKSMKSENRWKLGGSSVEDATLLCPAGPFGRAVSEGRP